MDKRAKQLFGVAKTTSDKRRKEDLLTTLRRTPERAKRVVPYSQTPRPRGT